MKLQGKDKPNPNRRVKRRRKLKKKRRRKQGEEKREERKHEDHSVCSAGVDTLSGVERKEYAWKRDEN